MVPGQCSFPDPRYTWARASRVDFKNLAYRRNAFVYSFRQSLSSPSTSGDRYDGFVTSVTSGSSSFWSSTVVGSIAFFAQRFLDDLTIALEFQILRSGTTIVIYGA